MFNSKSLLVLLIILLLFFFNSCNTIRTPQIKESEDKKAIEESEIVITPPVYMMPSIKLYDNGIKTQQQLVCFFCDKNSSANINEINSLANLYIQEAKIEGINSDVAFVQMCLETGFLKFGNLVTREMNNFCGLGAIDAEHPGNIFESNQIGVRAHIQHLHAYGSTVDLKNNCVDNRYKYVKPRGKAPTIMELAGTWASDREYGKKLYNLLRQLAEY